MRFCLFIISYPVLYCVFPTLPLFPPFPTSLFSSHPFLSHPPPPFLSHPLPPISLSPSASLSLFPLHPHPPTHPDCDDPLRGCRRHEAPRPRPDRRDQSRRVLQGPSRAPPGHPRLGAPAQPALSRYRCGPLSAASATTTTTTTTTTTAAAASDVDLDATLFCADGPCA